MADRGYAPANGLEVYHEVHGEGDPLVLLHGGFTTIDVSFGGLIPALAENRRLVAVEQQGHGRTPDAGRPLSFARMADDTAAALGHLGIEKADLFGYSDVDIEGELAQLGPTGYRPLRIGDTLF